MGQIFLYTTTANLATWSRTRSRARLAWRELTGVEEHAFVALPSESGRPRDIGTGAYTRGGLGGRRGRRREVEHEA